MTPQLLPQRGRVVRSVKGHEGGGGLMQHVSAALLPLTEVSDGVGQKVRGGFRWMKTHLQLYGLHLACR